MAIIMAGKQFTADQIQQTAGDLASLIRDAIQRGDAFRIQLETWQDADLIVLGLTQDEINAVKGFFIGDLPALKDALVASTWIKQLIGTGV
jgi:hypothetical protein